LIQLVIFDCDGTLVDTELLSNVVLARALTKLGVPTTTEESLATYKGRFVEDILAEISGRLGRPVPDDFWPAYEQRRDEVFRREVRPIDGAAEAVQAVLAAGLKACVASQAKLEKSELTLGLTGLRGLFGADHVFSAHDVPRGKPEPDLFLHAAAKMGVAPEQSVVVEDTPLGVQAGVAAGMRVLALVEHDGGWARELGGEPITSLRELPVRLNLS
jgi:HAD superfamily hydrolase (TIGR01509 family)